MPILRMGNSSAVEIKRDENDVETRTPLPGTLATTVGLPDDTDADGNLVPLWSLDEAFTTVTNSARGIWAMQSSAPGPDWVSCPDWPALESRLAGYYGCQIGVQAGYGVDDLLPEPPAPPQEG